MENTVIKQSFIEGFKKNGTMYTNQLVDKITQAITKNQNTRFRFSGDFDGDPHVVEVVTTNLTTAKKQLKDFIENDIILSGTPIKGYEIENCGKTFDTPGVKQIALF